MASETAAGLSRADLSEFQELRLTQAIAALEAGEVDALLATEAVPSPALQALAHRRPGVRFVSLERDIVNRLSSEFFAYYPFTVPARTSSIFARPCGVAEI